MTESVILHRVYLCCLWKHYSPEPSVYVLFPPFPYGVRDHVFSRVCVSSSQGEVGGPSLMKQCEAIVWYSRRAAQSPYGLLGLKRGGGGVKAGVPPVRRLSC